jgi:O-antigen/teichoic acid export membrane protein
VSCSRSGGEAKRREGPSGSSYGRNVLISVGAVAVMSLMALANNVVIARLCGPEGRGVYGVSVAIGALALPLASLGLGQATTWQLGRGRSLAQLLGLARRLIGLNLVLALATSGIIACGWRLSSNHTALTAVLAAALALPAQVIVELGRGVALGRARALAYNLCSAVVIATLLGLNLITAARGPSWVLINLVLANWAVALVLIGLSLRASVEPPEPTLTRSSLSYGWRSAVVALCDAAMLRIDYLIAAPIVGLAAIGIYAIADQISHLMAWAGLLAGKMMLPEAARDSDGRASLAKLGFACRLLIAVLLAASLLAAAAGAWVIVALFGQAFESAYLALLILLPATIAKGLQALIATWLQGRGAQQPIVRGSAIAVAVEAVAVASLALTIGWLGIAIAKTVAHVLQLGLSMRALQAHRRELGLDEGEHLLPGGRWLLDREDLAALRRWLDRRRTT